MRAFKTHLPDLAAIAFLVVLIAISFADILAGQRALYVRDVARLFHPNMAALTELIRAGALPY